MLNAKINVNGIEWSLTGDREDIVYALRNTASTSIPTEKQIIDRLPMGSFVNHDLVNTPSKLMTKVVDSNGTAKFSKEDTIRMYQYLATQGNFRIQQFEITRGGKTNPTQYTVCLVFDNTKQRYCYYNPKSEDRFIQTFTINDVITRINASESGFSMLHSVANRIWEKMSIVEGFIKIVSPFPTDATFTNYESKKIHHNAPRARASNGRFTKKH